MKKLSNTEADLKKSVAYKKKACTTFEKVSLLFQKRLNPLTAAPMSKAVLVYGINCTR